MSVSVKIRGVFCLGVVRQFCRLQPANSTFFGQRVVLSKIRWLLTLKISRSGVLCLVLGSVRKDRTTVCPQTSSSIRFRRPYFWNHSSFAASGPPLAHTERKPHHNSPHVYTRLLIGFSGL